MRPFVLMGKARDRTCLKGMSSILDMLSLRLDIQLEMLSRKLDM